MLPTTTCRSLSFFPPLRETQLERRGNRGRPSLVSQQGQSIACLHSLPAQATNGMHACRAQPTLKPNLATPLRRCIKTPSPGPIPPGSLNPNLARCQGDPQSTALLIHSPLDQEQACALRPVPWAPRRCCARTSGPFRNCEPGLAAAGSTLLLLSFFCRLLTLFLLNLNPNPVP